MNIRHLIKPTLTAVTLIAAFVSASLGTLQAQESEEIERTPILEDFSSPNVILIVADGAIWSDDKNVKALIPTPHLDKLAASSIRWKEFYVSPVCSPTRASLMTGRYNQRTKCVDTFLGRSMMATDEVTLAEALQGAGYSTAIFGKWHLGDNYPMRPSDQGFEYSLIHKGGGIAEPSEPIANDKHFINPILFLNNHETLTEGFCNDIFFNDAIRFINKAVDHQQPFFAYICPTMPKDPTSDLPKDLLEQFNNKDLASLLPEKLKNDAAKREQITRIATITANMDQNIGKLIKALEKNKSIDNTIIIYLHDKGALLPLRTAKWRGTRGDILEGGIRSPLLIHWPRKFPKPMTITSNIAAHIDIMPTIMDACDMGTPEAFAFDGRSLLKKMLKPDSTEPEYQLKPRPLIIQAHRGATPIRYHNFMIREQQWKLSNNSGFFNTRLKNKQAFTLYNLAEDPAEAHDLAAKFPDKVKHLTKLYDDWYDDVKDSRIRSKGTPYILVHRDRENPVVLTWQSRISQNWGLEYNGLWKLDFQHKALIDVRLETPPHYYNLDLTGYTPVLQVGNKEYRGTPLGKQQLATFLSISIPKGKTTLMASFLSPDEAKEIPAYQLRLIHR